MVKSKVGILYRSHAAAKIPLVVTGTVLLVLLAS
jgi:hypothetical protein